MKTEKNATLAIRNMGFGLLSVATQILGTSILFFVIARTPSVTVTDFGIITYAFSVSQLFVVLFEYGMVPYLSKEKASSRIRNYDFERFAYGLHFALMLLGYLIFTHVIQYFRLSEMAQEICRWVGAGVFVTSSLRFFQAFYQGNEKLHLEFFSTASEMVVMLCVIIFAFMQDANVFTIAQFLFFGRLLTWTVAYIIFGLADYWLFPSYNFRAWIKILIEALPFGMMFVIAFAITSIDTLMLQFLTFNDAEYQVGLYQAAIRLVLLPTILTMVATKVFLPQLARMGTEKSTSITHNLLQLNNLLQSIGFLLGVFVIYHADGLVSLVYGEQYGEVAQLVQVLGITLVLRFGAAYNLYFTLNGKMWLRVVFALSALFSTILLNFLLIPRYGALGVAISSAVTHVIYSVPFWVAMKIYEGRALFGWHIKRSIVIGLSLLALLYVTDQFPLWLNLLWVSLFIFVAGFYSMKRTLRSKLLRVLSNQN